MTRKEGMSVLLAVVDGVARLLAVSTTPVSSSFFPTCGLSAAGLAISRYAYENAGVDAVAVCGARSIFVNMNFASDASASLLVPVVLVGLGSPA